VVLVAFFVSLFFPADVDLLLPLLLLLEELALVDVDLRGVRVELALGEG